MTQDLEQLRTAFVEDEAACVRLCEWAKDRLRIALKTVPVYYPVVDGRSKDVQSFLKKAMLYELEDPESEIKDRVGVRVIVTFKSDVAEVEKVIRDTFHFISRTDKSEGLEDDRLGYLGIHYMVKRRADDTSADEISDSAFEVQIHSKAENAWAGA